MLFLHNIKFKNIQSFFLFFLLLVVFFFTLVRFFFFLLFAQFYILRICTFWTISHYEKSFFGQFKHLFVISGLIFFMEGIILLFILFTHIFPHFTCFFHGFRVCAIFLFFYQIFVFRRISLICRYRFLRHHNIFSPFFPWINLHIGALRSISISKIALFIKFFLLFLKSFFIIFCLLYIFGLFFFTQFTPYFRTFREGILVWHIWIFLLEFGHCFGIEVYPCWNRLLGLDDKIRLLWLLFIFFH